MKQGIEEKLLKWKHELEEHKVEKSRLEGQRTELLRRLKNEFGCDSIEVARKRLASMQTSLDKLNIQLEKGVEEYEEKYGDEDE